jgi:hypothetical protein
LANQYYPPTTDGKAREYHRENQQTAINNTNNAITKIIDEAKKNGVSVFRTVREDLIQLFE